MRASRAANYDRGESRREQLFLEIDMISFHRFSGFFAILAAVAVTSAGPARAQDSGPADARQSPVLVELFLSQSCPMCPPAAALFPSYAAREDVVALTWHVDYWNMTASPAGRWEDPYSKASHTERQKRYNKNIRQRSSIYTPQIVVDGVDQTVGASADKINALLESVSRDAPKVTSLTEDGTVSFKIGESETGGNAYLVTYYKEAETDVTGGKNAGMVFSTHNVVKDIQPLGVVRKRGGDLSAPAPADGEGCALIVQAPGQKRVVAAAYCPA